MQRSISIVCRISLAVALLMSGGMAMQVAAQVATASINGTVLDQTGAVVPDARITVKNVRTGLERSTVTNQDGFFAVTSLPVGEYEVSIERDGFATLKRSELRLTVGQVLTLDVVLMAAGRQEVMEVTGEAPIIEVTRTSVNSTVNDVAVANLPVNGRNFIDFVLLTPGVSRDVRTGDIAFGGQRGTLNSLLIDGADNNNTFFGQALGRTGSGRAPYQFSQDAVQEFQVNSNSYSAEFGRAGGAVINVITKSGTNQFHGTAFDFYRDKSMNANTFFNNANARPRAAFHIHQFGGNIGGPIVKDKAFFFFNYDGQRRNEGQPIIFPVSAAPNDTVGLQVQQRLFQRYGNPYIRGFNQDVFLGKGDWQISRNHRLSGRYNHQDFTGKNLENSGPTSAEEHSGDSLVKTNTLTLQLTSVLSNTFINELRFQWARDKEPGTANTDVPEAIIQERGTTVISIGRNNFSPRETTIRRYQVANTMSLIRGKHNLKFGFDINVDRTRNFFPGLFGGSYTFTSYADFADGIPAGGYRQNFAGPNTTGPLTRPNTTDYAAFIQDDWRVSPDFTFYLGLRYDLQDLAQPTTRNPHPDLAAMNIRTDRVNIDSNNWGPRIGLAWSPLQSDRLVIRAGYGVFYGRTPSIMLGTAHSNNGLNVIALSFTGAAVPTYPNRFSSIPTGGAAAPPTLYFFAPDYVSPQTQQASLGIEYELARNLAVAVNYIFVKGTHLSRTRNINLRPAVLSTIQIAGGGGTVSYLRFPGRLTSAFDRLSQFESTANSVYNGLAMKLTKRFANHFQLLASYTWSAAIDDAPDQTSVVPGNAGDDAKMIQNPLFIRGDRARSVVDVPHRFVLSGVWELNYANKLENAVARAILGGWSLSGILTANSGFPYSQQTGFDLNNDGNRFTDRAPGVGRNTERLPRFISFDPRVTRDIRFGERAKLQLIWEAFNVLNRANFSAVRTTLFAAGSGATAGQLVRQTNFGTPTSTFDPRIMQLAAKFVF
ncbi:MAG: TonB-dependent receptor [Acidobacteriota bacterium]|nr:TonB-dependent receptor [Blastocatellia bacterium]MDW8238683.1 TonB-dependent receptor [Acidobacteriota bacterium]